MVSLSRRRFMSLLGATALVPAFPLKSKGALATFIGGAGRGAVASVVAKDGVITAINIMSAGYGYTSPPMVTIAW